MAQLDLIKQFEELKKMLEDTIKDDVLNHKTNLEQKRFLTTEQRLASLEGDVAILRPLVYATLFPIIDKHIEKLRTELSPEQIKEILGVLEAFSRLTTNKKGNA